MAGFSSYLAGKIYDATLNPSRVSLSAPSALYLALHTSAPDDASAGGETSYTGYARVVVSSAFTSATVVSGTERTLAVSNSSQIAFGAKTGGVDPTITSWGIYDALTGGNMLYSGTLTASRSIQDGDIPVFQAGELVINLV